MNPLTTLSKFALGTLAIGTLTLTPQVAGANTPVPNPSPPASGIFRCVQLGNGYATVAVKKDGTLTSPVITWSRTLGDTFTPQRRCEIVTQKFNTAVAQNDGTLSGLLLTVGRVGPTRSLRVVCYVNSLDAICNENNMLFTISPTNRQSAREVLFSLINFGVDATGSPVDESAGAPYISLERSLTRAGAVTSTRELNNRSSLPPVTPNSPSPNVGSQESAPPATPPQPSRNDNPLF
jgi:hypothetical protein